jgi:ArsR family transcriptional regulator, arsenate/arsenite/antimonite-responsive transcriptional repressor
VERKAATRIFECLASGVRLDIYRLLIKQGPEGMVSGQIANALAIPANTASFHLKALSQAGLLSVQQESRFQRYRANVPLMSELIAYLTEECCGGHPDQCVDLQTGATCPTAVLPQIAERSKP